MREGVKGYHTNMVELAHPFSLQCEEQYTTYTVTREIPGNEKKSHEEELKSNRIL